MKGIGIIAFVFGVGAMVFYRMIDKSNLADAFLGVCMLLSGIFLLAVGLYLFFTKEEGNS